MKVNENYAAIVNFDNYICIYVSLVEHEGMLHIWAAIALKYYFSASCMLFKTKTFPKPPKKISKKIYAR